MKSDYEWNILVVSYNLFVNKNTHTRVDFDSWCLNYDANNNIVIKYYNVAVGEVRKRKLNEINGLQV